MTQPVGHLLPDWSPRPQPQRLVLQGRWCRLEPLDAQKHGESLFSAHQRAADDSIWTYLPVGPFRERLAFEDYLQQAAHSVDPLHYAVIDPSTEGAVGTMSLMRVQPEVGVIEVGHVVFSPLLQRTPLSTEAQFLLMRHVFEELGYRRYEWKCDALNADSQRAARRLGFRYEGCFRQATIYKGRNRDTAWYSILDGEWPALRQAYQAWLDPQNFDSDGQQRQSLTQLQERAGLLSQPEG